MFILFKKKFFVVLYLWIKFMFKFLIKRFLSVLNNDYFILINISNYDILM